MDIDMAAEVDTMYRIDVDLLAEWYPKFDPQEFQRYHLNMKIEDFALHPEHMHVEAHKTLEIRQKIEQKVKAMRSMNPQPA